MQRLVGEALGLPPGDVPIHADLFALGLDSLRAGRLAGALREAAGVPLQIGTVYSCRTVGALAAELAAQRAAAGLGGASRLGQGGLGGGAPLEPAVQPCNPKAPAALLVQALPSVLLCPVRRISKWFLFLLILWLVR